MTDFGKRKWASRSSAQKVEDYKSFGTTGKVSRSETDLDTAERSLTMADFSASGSEENVSGKGEIQLTSVEVTDSTIEGTENSDSEVFRALQEPKEGRQTDGSSDNTKKGTKGQGKGTQKKKKVAPQAAFTLPEEGDDEEEARLDEILVVDPLELSNDAFQIYTEAQKRKNKLELKRERQKMEQTKARKKQLKLLCTEHLKKMKEQMGSSLSDDDDDVTTVKAAPPKRSHAAIKEIEDMRQDRFTRSEFWHGAAQLRELDVWPEEQVAGRRLPPPPHSRVRSSPPKHREDSRLRGEFAELACYFHHSRSCSPSPLESGMYDRATLQIVEKLVWPQKNLHYIFLQEGLSFQQLTFSHLVVGETTTIKCCDDKTEHQGRLRLMERISYWVLWGPRWDQIHRFYATVLWGIEAHKISWGSDWGSLESMMIDKPEAGAAVKPDKGQEVKLKAGDEKKVPRKDKEVKPEKKDPKVNKTWFCRDFNNAMGCTLPASHPVLDTFGIEREAQHVCSRCLKVRKIKADHSVASELCPQNKSA